jgi:hypothetical protein
MKKILLLVLAAISANFAISQTVADFENLNLAPDTFWNGNNLNGGFSSGNAFFGNYFDTTYSSWEGFAYSNMKDSITAGYSNMYSAVTASGYNNSNNYAVAAVGGYYEPTYIKLTNAAKGKMIDGFYVTNNTYAYLSMRDGDLYSKQFGGSTANDTDWFKLRINGFLNGNMTSNVDFYLADYRFADNSQDYIIKDWTWVDLSSLGNVDSLTFELSSTDNGSWGMNTPAFFCMDNFISMDGVGFEEIAENDLLNIYPNPSNGIVNIEVKNQNSILRLFDLNGKVLLEKTLNASSKIDLQHFEKGVYIIQIQSDNKIQSKKLILN